MRSLVSLLATALLAALLVIVPSGTATAAKSPARDFPHMPRQCATPQEKIPAKPIVCALNEPSRDRPTVVLWGDSHSWMFIPALRRAATNKRVNLVAVMMGSCPPMDNGVGPNEAAPACFRSNALGIDFVGDLERAGQTYRVVLAASWQRYLHAIETGDRTSYVGTMAIAMKKGTPRLVRTLKAIGAEVDVVGQVATVPAQRKRCAAGNQPYACNLPRSRSLPDFAATSTYVRETMRPLLGGRSPINVNPFFCTPKVCKGKVGSTRTWFDNLHISASMSTRLAPYLAPTIAAVRPDQGGPGEPGEPGEPGDPGGPDLCDLLPVPVIC